MKTINLLGLVSDWKSKKRYELCAHLNHSNKYISVQVRENAQLAEKGQLQAFVALTMQNHMSTFHYIPLFRIHLIT